MRWLKKNLHIKVHKSVHIVLLVGVILFCVGIGIPVGVIIAYWNDLPSLEPLEYETQSWRYPTKVYSDICRFSVQMSLVNLLERLERLDYKQVSEEPAIEGQFHLEQPVGSSTNELSLYLRGLNYPRLILRPRMVKITVEDRKIVKIEDADGKELNEFILEPEEIAEFYGSEGTDRELVSLDKIPKDLINAFIAIEDKRFYNHSGFDPYRIVGALFWNLRNPRSITKQGASTITQQLARDLFLNRRQFYSRKIKEALLAIRIERKYTKDEILERYLNRVNLGRYGSREIYGVREAARYYFGKEVWDLNIQECATLAAIPKDQIRYSPIRNPDKSISRRQIVLGQMLRYGFIDKAQYDAAVASELGIISVKEQKSHKQMGYFLEYIRAQVEANYKPSAINWQGMEIYTTLDVSTQFAANRAVEGHLQELDGSMLGFPPYESNRAKWFAGERRAGVRDPVDYLQAALVAIEPSTGSVKAMVGGRDWYATQYNRAVQASRQPGSAFKPFVYCAGFASKLITPATIVVDEPWQLADPSQPDGFWKPRNFYEKHYGRVTVRKMLVHSINVATARLLAETIGPEKAANMARKMGIKSPLPSYPSLALGAAEVKVLEITSAYGVFANQGVRAEPISVKYILDREGRILEENTPSIQRVLDRELAYLVTYLMEDVVDEGTGRNLRRIYYFDRPAAGKTGTTNDESDAWFLGFVPNLVAGVWVGFDDFTRSTRCTGAVGALPIWSDFMKSVVDGPEEDFQKPDGIVMVMIDKDTGLPATKASTDVIEEAFIKGTEPKY